MRKDLSQIYIEMYKEDSSDINSPKELLEKVSVDRFALNDYSKLIYENSIVGDNSFRFFRFKTTVDLTLG